MSSKKTIITDLRRKFEVDECFYPNISIEIDVSNGFEGEVSNLIELLNDNSLEVTSQNVFNLMELKKSLLLKFNESEGAKNALENYRKLMLEEIKPAGSAIPIEYLFASGLLTVILYALSRFIGSFADESGKQLAQKLFEKNEETAKELDIDLREYNFIINEAKIILEDKRTVDSIKQKLKKKSQ